MPCRHPYAPPRQASCPHPVLPDADLCLWHRGGVPKGDAYVPALIRQADDSAKGDLEDASLVGLVMPGAELPGRNLRGADLRDADLCGAKLCGSDLGRAILRRARLRQADLSLTVLAGADLTGCDLTGADLSGADLSGAILDGTVLLGANLSEATLTGAQIRSFAWNRRTRLDGVLGLQPEAFQGSGCARSSLDDDPELDRTHLYLVPVSMANEPGTDLHPDTEGAHSSPLTPHRWRRPTALVLLGAASFLVGIVGALVVAQTRRSAEPLATPVIANATAPAVAPSTVAVDPGWRDQVRFHQGESQALRQRLTEAEAELSRLRAADDAAVVAGERLITAQADRRALAGASARQETIGRILAEGVDRLNAENLTLTTTRDELQAQAARLPALERESSSLAKELTTIRNERDTLRRNLDAGRNELAQARTVIERYLTRVRATALEDDLVTGRDAPLLALSPGVPVALGGDYVVTLRCDGQVERDGIVTMDLVVQQSTGGSAPDIAVVLYDAKQQPLQRVSYSFPQADMRRGFVSAGSRLVLGTFPSFARVTLTPPVGAESVSMK